MKLSELVKLATSHWIAPTVLASAMVVGTPVAVNTIQQSALANAPIAYTNKGVQIDLTASTDTPSGIATAGYSWNGGGAYTRDKIRTFLVNQTVSIAVKDNAGNISRKTVTITNIDKVLPVVKANISETGWTNYDKTIAVSATDTVPVSLKADYAESGIAAYAVVPTGTQPALNDAVWNNKTTWIVDDDSSYSVYAKDNAGNIGKCDISYSAQVDKQMPVIGQIQTTAGTANTKVITASGIGDTGGSGLSGYIINTTGTKPTAAATWNSSALSTIAYTATENATYYMWVIDHAGNISATSSVAVTGIVDKVSGTTYPTADSVKMGGTVTPTLHYDGVPKSVTYHSSNVNVATVTAEGQVSGNDYGTADITVRLTDYDGTLTARVCTVSVTNIAPKIKTHPMDVEATPDSTVHFAVTASGTNLQFRWYRSSGAGWTEVAMNDSVYQIRSTPTSSRLEIPRTTLAMSDTQYYCKVWNKGNDGVDSNVGTLQIFAPPEIIKQPANAMVDEGTMAQFSIRASGGYPAEYTYKWYRGTDVGEIIPNETSNTYEWHDTKTSDNGAFVYCVVSNGKFQVTSERVYLSVYGKPTFPPTFTVYDFNTGNSIADGAWTNAPVKFTLVHRQSETIGAGSLGMQYSMDGGATWVSDYISGTQVQYDRETTSQGLTILARCYNTSRPHLYEQSTYKLCIDRTVPMYTSIRPNTTEIVRDGQGVILTIANAQDAISGLDTTPYSYDGGQTWTAVAGKTVFENGTYDIKIKDMAGNVTGTSIVVNNIEVITQADLISRVTDITGSVIGKTGYIDDASNVVQYQDSIVGDTGETITGLKVEFKTVPMTGNYVKAYAEVMGERYPVIFNNARETDVESTSYISTGSFVIDPSVLNKSARTTSVKIYATMYSDETCNFEEESEQYAMFISVDVSAPVSVVSYNEYSKQLTINVRDVLSEIESVLYMISYADGTTASGTGSASFALPIEKPATVTVTATDVLGNTRTTISKPLKPENPEIPDGGGGDPDGGGGEGVPAGAYHYKTHTFDCIIIGGNQSN